MQALVLHPTEKRIARHRVRANVRRIASSDLVSLCFEVEMASNVEWGIEWGAERSADDKLGLENGSRVDGLWKSTCFECFAGQSSASYLEWNFAPSANWASYRFDAYREGMRNANVAAPTIVSFSARDLARFEIDFALPVEMQTGAVAFSLTAVILEKGDANPYYWALVHSGPKPDFHLRESFILELEC